MKKVKLGLIGLGYAGKMHLRNGFKLENGKIVAVCDLSNKTLRFARSMGIKKIFRDYQQLLKEPNIDGVIISLPTHLHASCAQKAAEAGKHIFLEKPLARNVKEGKEIVAMVRRYCVNLMVGYPLRFSSSFRALKERIQSGTLGEVAVAHSTWVGPGPFFHRLKGYTPQPVPAWWFDRNLTGGGALMDLGSHLINLLRWYFGRVSDIKSFLGHRFNLEFEDSAICTAKFSSGPTAIVNVGWFSSEGKIRVELLGTAKHISASHAASNKVVAGIQLLIGKTPKFDLPYLAELEHFVCCIKHGFHSNPDGDDALEDLKVISSAYKNEITLE